MTRNNALAMRPRFRLRSLMIAVVVVGIGIGLEVMRRRRSYFEQRALVNAMLSDIFTHGFHHNGPDPREAAYFGRLRLKYERAARYPCLPVEPDPPRPE